MAIKDSGKRKFNQNRANTYSSRLSHSERKISFSFTYLTKKKDYTLEFYRKSKSIKGITAIELYEKLSNLSNHTWKELEAKPSTFQYERIGYSQLRFNANENAEGDNSIEFSGDTKVCVFRFNNQDGRIIGIKREGCPTLHVIGLDLNFSAYDHGS